MPQSAQLIGIGWLLIDFLSKKMGFQGESLVIPYLLYLFAAVFFGLAELAIAAQKGFDPQRGQLSKIVILICTFVPPMQLGLIYFFGKNIDRYFAERNLRNQ